MRERITTWPDRSHPRVILAAVLIVVLALSAALVKYISDGGQGDQAQAAVLKPSATSHNPAQAPASSRPLFPDVASHPPVRSARPVISDRSENLASASPRASGIVRQRPAVSATARATVTETATVSATATATATATASASGTATATPTDTATASASPDPAPQSNLRSKP